MGGGVGVSESIGMGVCRIGLHTGGGPIEWGGLQAQPFSTVLFDHPCIELTFLFLRKRPNDMKADSHNMNLSVHV